MTERKPCEWDNTTVCFGSDCPNCEREKKAKPAPAEAPKVQTSGYITRAKPTPSAPALKVTTMFGSAIPEKLAPAPVEKAGDVPTCVECGCTPGVRPRECKTCMDFVIEEGLALRAEVDRQKAMTATGFRILKERMKTLHERTAELAQAREEIATRKAEFESLSQTIKQLAAAREEITNLRAMLDDIEKLKVKRFSERHNPPCNNYDCDRCYR